MLYYLSLGSNLGERERTLSAAVELLNQQAGRVIARSAYFYSPAWGFSSEHPFCNICICLESALEPLELLHLTQAIEQQKQSIEQQKQSLEFKTREIEKMQRQAQQQLEQIAE